MPYGTPNIGCKEHLDLAGTGSFYNDGEAYIVTQHVLNLVHCGMYISFASLIEYHINIFMLVLHTPSILIQLC